CSRRLSLSRLDGQGINGFKLGIGALTGAAMGSETGVSDWVTEVFHVLALVLRALTLALNIPQDCVINFDVSFKIRLRHTLRLRNRSLISQSLINLGSMKLALVESRLVEITPSVLSKIIPPIEVVLIVLNRRESERSDLVCNHLWMETGVSLIIIGCCGL
nr:hypothetical protein [Tanacetum cinerariifolium]